MDVFKTKVGDLRSIPISLENLEKTTRREYPYFQIVNDKPVYYAICPLCDNPIRIINLFRKEYKSNDNSPKPYGRHIEHGVKDLAYFDREAYLACPYHRISSHGYKPKLRAENNKTGLAIYKLMKENFDRIIYIWNKTTDIKISRAFAQDLLSLWKKNKGWLYYDNTFNNLSYMLLYPLPGVSLVGRMIKKNSPLHAKLQNCKEIFFLDTKQKDYVQVKKKGFL